MRKRQKFLNLDFVYVLPYYELSFCHRDHCRVSNYHFLSARFKFGLRFKEHVLWTVKPWFHQHIGAIFDREIRRIAVLNIGL